MDPLEKPLAAALGGSLEESQREQWFSEMFHSLNTDKLLLDTGTASDEKKAFYAAVMSNDVVAASAKAKEVFNQTLTKDALLKFLVRVFESGHRPRKIAFNTADSSLLVWAVVADDDYDAERALYLAQAAINPEFAKADYRVNTTVVDESDHFPTPAHYQELVLPKQ